mmetsp:Transcript_179/g.318  ORF Transcript_179/g.318 Transcript_179/m.318 type:complete len:81 (+) Transcript_179:346-588(+)
MNILQQEKREEVNKQQPWWAVSPGAKYSKGHSTPTCSRTTTMQHMQLWTSLLMHWRDDSRPSDRVLRIYFDPLSKAVAAP